MESGGKAGWSIELAWPTTLRAARVFRGQWGIACPFWAKSQAFGMGGAGLGFWYFPEEQLVFKGWAGLTSHRN